MQRNFPTKKNYKYCNPGIENIKYRKAFSPHGRILTRYIHFELIIVISNGILCMFFYMYKYVCFWNEKSLKWMILKEKQLWFERKIFRKFHYFKKIFLNMSKFLGDTLAKFHKIFLYIFFLQITLFILRKDWEKSLEWCVFISDFGIFLSLTLGTAKFKQLQLISYKRYLECTLIQTRLSIYP